MLKATVFHVNHLYTLGFALDLRERLCGARSAVPLILETHFVNSHLVRQKGDQNPITGRQDGLQRLIRSEAVLLDKADVLTHLSFDDWKFFRSLLPSKAQFLALPGVDRNFRSSLDAAAEHAETIDLLFVGQWHAENLAGLRWFFKEVWPLIAERNYKLRIVGLVGEMVRQKLPGLYDSFRACFTGEVADLAPYYRATRCVIAPVLSGTGVSIKTIEALAAGKPFVGTRNAFRGLPMEHLEQAGIHPHDDAHGFADAICRALSGEAEACGSSRTAYEAIFSPAKCFAQRDEALRAATAAANRRLAISIDGQRGLV